ncbi:MAG: hypothetical protein JO202_00230 [Ktedonobacteraceae bacterium]|nr:hypothetical protein [Ktedonobacteraceae bacterium]
MRELEYAEAVKLFIEAGLSESTFRRKIKEHPIRHRMPEGRSRGAFYSEEDVKKAIEQNRKERTKKTIQGLKDMSRRIEKPKAPTKAEIALKDTIFRRAKPEDAQGMYELAERILSREGGHGIPPEKLIRFLSIPNSEIGHVLIKDNRIIGYFTIVPLRYEQVMQKMRREINISDILAEDLPMPEPGKRIECFIWEVMSEPKEKAIGQYLISKMLEFFHTLGKRGVEIEGVYAVASSIEGTILSYKVGMKLMKIPNITQPNYMPFELKVQENKNWLTKDYIHALESYKRRQERLERNALTLLDNEQKEEIHETD